MKNYKTKEELIADMRIAFNRDNPFEKYTYERLDNPKLLIKEYKENPTLAFGNNAGWMFVWKNQHTKIDDEWVKVEDLLNKLSEFLDDEKSIKKCPKCVSKNINKTGVSHGVGYGENVPITSFGYRCNDCGHLFILHE